MITDQQVEFYRENGYIVVENVLSPAELDAMRSEVDTLVEQSAEVRENDDIYDLEDTHSAEHPRVRRIKLPHLYMKSAAAVVRHEKMVSILQRLLGSSVRFQTSKLNMKSAGFGASVNGIKTGRFIRIPTMICAVGVFIDDGGRNGAMMVLPAVTGHWTTTPMAIFAARSIRTRLTPICRRRFRSPLRPAP